MEITKKQINLWSKMGSRATFGLSLLELQKQYNDLMVLTSDVSTSAGLDRFRNNFPDKFVDVGISEQNLIGVATGLAKTGYNVVTTTFSPFQTMRCCEQIKNNLGYMKTKVTLVGLASGLVLGTLGFTHASIEDIGSLRSIPNIQIISPADCTETVKSVVACLENPHPTYIRLTGGQLNPPVYEDDYKFQIGKAIKIIDGNSIAIVANGTRVKDAMNAAKKIHEDYGAKCSVYNFHTIKPIDEDKILEISKNHEAIISVEEHNIFGGLGSALAEAILKLNLNLKLKVLGINDTYPKGGEYNYLLKKLNLDSSGIYSQIKYLL